MDIDKVIAQLFDAKPITEQEVKLLCDTVSSLATIAVAFLKKRQTSHPFFDETMKRTTTPQHTITNTNTGT